MKRTAQQNKCLHSYLGQIAIELNEAGYDFKKVVKLPVTFTTENIKEFMFSPIMSLMYPDVESTTELTTIQMQKVYETFNSAIAERFSVSGDWPNRFNNGEIQG